MTKKIRCGRLMLTKDGNIEKVQLPDGGGSRWCYLDYQHMDFNEVHHTRTHMTQIYDFRRQKLNRKQYKTVKDYIQKHGLNLNSTIVYLCTREVDEENAQTTGMMKKKISNERRSVQTQTNPSSTSIENERTVSDNQPIILGFSFKKSIDSLIKNIHDLINKNGFNDILIQLFENISIIHDYIYFTIEQLNEHRENLDEYYQSLDQHQIEIYMNSLNNIYHKVTSTITILEVNKNRFSTITNSFMELHEHLKNLRCLWLNIDNNNNNFNAVSTSSITIEPISSNFDIRLLSPDVDDEDSIEILEISSSSHELSVEEIKEKKNLFRPVLNCCHNLLNILRPINLPSIRADVGSAIGQIKELRSKINLYDKDSIIDAQETILSLRDLFDKLNEKQNQQSQNTFDQELIRLLNNTLKSLFILSTCLDNYCLSSNEKRKFDDIQSFQSNKRK